MDVWAEFDVMEMAQGKARGQGDTAGVPPDFQACRPTDEGGQPCYFVRLPVAAHEAHARDGRTVAIEQRRQFPVRQRLPRVTLQPRAVAAGAAVGAAGNVEGQRRLVGDFAEDDVVADIFQHDSISLSASSVSVSAPADAAS